MDIESAAPKVFISYSHNDDRPDYKDRILELANRLRSDGIDCNIDQYEESPAEGWSRWMLNQIDWANFVLIACTQEYERRFRGNEAKGKGKGGTWEGGVIIDEIYHSQGNNSKFIPIALNSEDSQYIPSPLRSATDYKVDTDDGYDLLCRRLTNQPKINKPSLGKLQTLPPRDRKQNFMSISKSQAKQKKIDPIKAAKEKKRVEEVYNNFLEIEIDSDNLLDFQLENKYVRVQLYLPILNGNPCNYQICGEIEFKEKFKNDDTSPLFRLKHLDLLEIYFKNYRSPIEYREFLSFITKNSENCNCYLGGTKITISKEKAQSLCDAFDLLFDKYRKQIGFIEGKWRSINFKITSGFGDEIPLIAIDRELWSILIDFAHYHDCIDKEENRSIKIARHHKETEEKWNIFYKNSTGHLKVFTENASDRYERGFHVRIKSRQIDNESKYNSHSEILLLWQPSYDPNEHRNEFSSRYYWDVETTYNWLVKEVIPYALFWNREIRQARRMLWVINKKSTYENFLKEYDEKEYTYSYREEFSKDKLLVNSIESLDSLTSDLQRFYACTSGYYFHTNDYVDLCRSLYLSLEHSSFSIDQYSYLQGNLNGIFANSENVDKLKQSIKNKTEEINDSLLNYGSIELIFRCISSCARDCKSNLTKQEIENIANWLKPFSDKMEHDKLLKRQIARLS